MKRLLLLVLIWASITVMGASMPKGGDSDFEMTEEATHIPAMILVQEADVDETIADLEEQGVIVLRHRENILLTFIPIDKGEGNDSDVPQKLVRRVKGVKDIVVSKPRRNKPLMNIARNFNNANFINEGKNLPQPYDGSGVVVGVCDIGIDTRHPNFLSADGSECRIRKVVHYEELQGRFTEYTDPQDIYDWQTDNADEWHATHVTGIAAGAYSGGNKEKGFQSLAPGADIVLTCSMLSDVGLLCGVEDIIDYAAIVNKPAVINLSMGSNIGPHDGTSLFTRYLDLCAEDAIICISAGNEGDGEGSATSTTYDFTEGNTVYQVRTSDWGGTDYDCVAEVWSRDATPFKLTFYWRNDTQASNNIFAYPALEAKDGETVEWRISTDPEDPDYDETFDAHFTEGYVRVRAGLSPLNGRYYANVEFDLESDELHGNQAWAEYWAAIKIEGEPGTHIDINITGHDYVGLFTERNFRTPNNELCISDLATGFKTISVGMKNNREYRPGQEAGSGYADGDVNVHSSYGTLIDGRKLPTTVAPGAMVISSISSAYLDKYPEMIPAMSASAEYDGRTVYWVNTIGTSMSCPFVVSAIATWLQAYPLLTSEEAKEIILKTNQTSGYPNPTDPRHGQGWFQPYRGLQEVVGLAALKGGTIDAPDFTLRFDGNRLLIGNPAADSLVISVYTPAGILMESLSIADSLSNISLNHLPHGIYIINAHSTLGSTQSLKIAL